MRRLPVLLIACLAGCDCQPRPLPMDDAGVDAGTDPDAGVGLLEISLSEFGEVLRGNSVDRPVLFKNARTSAVDLTLSVTGAGFSLVGPSSLHLEPGAEASVQVRFSPAGLGRQAGVFTYVDGSPDELPLIGTGIGPALELTPATIDLGTVALYDGADATASAMLTARNVGLDGNPPRPDTALLLFFEVEPATELCVGDCLGTGVSVDAGSAADLTVQLTSTTPGMKSWEVRVLSNDPAMPMLTLPVRAEVVARPTCQFAVPASLSFGLISTPETRELEVVLENVGTENCEIARIELGDPTPAQPTPLLSLVNAPFGPQIVAPGELLRVIVRAAPQSMSPAMPVAVAAELRFALNHPAGFARVPLSLELGPTCLLAAPSPVEFGVVQTGCRSADRTISLRNICARAIGITSATLPGFSSFSSSSALPAQLAPYSSLALTARYTPFAVGPSRDVIDVRWTDLGVTKHTTVPLVAEANATGENVERFPAGSTKLDLLLVIDDSCSMMDKLTTLNTQLPRVLTALLSNNVDFRIGVIDANGSTDGVLRTTASGLRWVTPSTPALSAEFAELTAYTGLLDNEGCEGPVLRALTPPNASDPLRNGGFLRPDSMLSVVCITDVSDQNFFVQEISQAKGAGRRFTWDDIGPVGPGTMQCGTSYFPRTGPTHRGTTGGQLLDICSTDWSPVLNEVASRPTGSRTFFPLQGTPDLLNTLPLTVNVSGQNVEASTDAGTSVWSWESSPNAVVFSPLYAPLASQPVSISYGVVCMP